MYTPPAFRDDTPEWLHSFVERHDFGLLISAEPLMASHLPFHLIRPVGDEPARLLCHLARANPHWQVFLGAGAPVLAMFRGSHAYVSTAWYGAHPAVPTWNYDAVEAQGHARLIEDQGQIATQMRALAAAYEPEGGFTMEDQPQKYMDGMFRALVGVEITVTRWTGKRKQSQNRPIGDRIAVAAALDARGEHAAASALREANALGQA